MTVQIQTNIPLITLVGGEIDAGLLSGSWSLVMRGVESKPADNLEGKAELVNGAWRLMELRHLSNPGGQVAFEFDVPARFGGNQAPSVVIAQVRAMAWNARLQAKAAKLRVLVDPTMPGKDGHISLPGGLEWILKTSVANGYAIEAEGDGFAVTFDGAQRSQLLTQSKAAIQIGRLATGRASVSPDTVRVRFESARDRSEYTRVQAKLDKSSGVRTLDDSAVELVGEELELSPRGAMLRGRTDVRKGQPRPLEFGRFEDDGLVASVRSRAERLTMWLPLGQEPTPAQLIFEAATDAWAEYESVIVDKLASEYGATEFRANIARFVATDDETWHFEVGGELGDLPFASEARSRLELRSPARLVTRTEMIVDGEGATATIDTRKAGRALTIERPKRLEVRPLGLVSRDSKQSDKFAFWELGAEAGSKLEFDRKTEDFADNWVSQFQPRKDQRLPALELPGLETTMGAKTRIERKLDDLGEWSNKPTYYVLGIVLGLGAYWSFFREHEKIAAIGDNALPLELELGDGQASWIQSHLVDDLRLLFDVRNPSAAFSGQLRAWHEAAPAGIDVLAFPLWKLLGIPLWRKTKGYLPKLLHPNGKPAYFAIDMSFEARLATIDWEKVKQGLAEAGLWTDGPNPTQIDWRGYYFENLPLYFVVDNAVPTDDGSTGLISDIINGLREGLVLDYGFFDVTGTTFLARLATTLKLLDNLVIKLALDEVRVGVARSKLALAEGRCTLELPWLKTDNHPGGYTLRTKFNWDFEGKLLNYIILEPPNAKQEKSQAIPGFDSIKVNRVALSPRTFASVDLVLYADASLSAALPALAEPLAVNVKVPLSKDGGPASLSLDLGRPIETRLFGKFAITIRGIRVDVGGEPRVRMRGTLKLGLLGFEEVGFLIDIHDGKFSLKLEKIDAKFGIGDWKLALTLAWVEGDPHDDKALELSKLPTQGPKRDFRAVALLDTGLLENGDTGSRKLELAIRVGHEGGRTYWAGVLAGGGGGGPLKPASKLSLGPLTLGEPALFLARNADMKNDGLAKALADIERPVFASLAYGNAATLWKFLDSWKPSDKVDLFFGVNGYVIFDGVVLEKAAEKSGLFILDSRVIRLDAWAKLFGTTRTHFAFVADLATKYLAAGLQLPSIDTGALKVHPGYVLVGLGLGSPRRLTLGLGFPRRDGADPLGWDWSRSVEIVLPGAWPINTFRGGLMLDIVEGQSVTLGYALSVGWSGEWNFIAIGHAQLRLDIGGIFIFEYSRRGPENALPEYVDTHIIETADVWTLKEWRDEDPFIEHLEACEELFGIAERKSDVVAKREELRAGIHMFVALKGSAYVKVFGVTVAGASISAYAGLNGVIVMNLDTGSIVIRELGVTLGFTFTVRILCYSYSATGKLDLKLK